MRFYFRQLSRHYKLKEHIFVSNILVVDALVGEIFSISIAFVAANVTLQFNGTEVDILPTSQGHHCSTTFH